MTETFDTYTRRPLIYKIMQFPGILLAIAFTMILFGDYLSKPLEFIAITCLFLGFVGFAVKLFWRNIPGYIKDGELLLEDDKLILNNNVLVLGDLKKIEIDCYNFATRPGERSRNDGTRNKIIITKLNGEIVEYHFVIASIQKSQKLGLIMKQWKQDGFKIISNGIDLI